MLNGELSEGGFSNSQKYGDVFVIRPKLRDVIVIHPSRNSPFTFFTCICYGNFGGIALVFIVELLITGFSGQLKGWWDYYLTNRQQEDILEAIKIDEECIPILDDKGNSQQDAVATLILIISLHFICDPSHLKDKNPELLSNLRCNKLSDFQSYKNTFLTRIMLIEVRQ